MGRGRSYPVIGLGEAITKASQLKDQDGTALTTPDAAVRAWGFKTLNGSSLRVVSALRQYGLLSDTGDQTKLSDRALTILLEPEGSAERQDALRAAAAQPAIFREIEEHYENNLPGEEALRSYIVRKLNLKEGPADKLAVSLRETRELVNGFGRSYSTPETEIPRVPETPETPEHLRQRGGSMPQIQSQQAQPFDLPILLDAGQATLRMPVPMSDEDFETLTEALELNLRLYRKKLTKGATAPPSSGEGG